MAVLLAGCAAPVPETASTHGWQPLFDGETTRGWRNVGVGTLDPRWQVHDDALTLTAPGGGDIVSVDRFDDFELVVEWRIAPGGNSGIFYRAADRAPLWHHAAEMQVLDDARADDRNAPSHRAGAVYDLVAPAVDAVRPAGEYNRARIVARGTRVEHWLNDRLVARYDTASDDWRARVAASKFAALPGFAAARAGHIGLQDHGGRVAFGSIRIRRLPPP